MELCFLHNSYLCPLREQMLYFWSWYFHLSYFPLSTWIIDFYQVLPIFYCKSFMKRFSKPFHFLAIFFSLKVTNSFIINTLICKVFLQVWKHLELIQSFYLLYINSILKITWFLSHIFSILISAFIFKAYTFTYRGCFFL